jgi:hypothetical protein
MATGRREGRAIGVPAMISSNPGILYGKVADPGPDIMCQDEQRRCGMRYELMRSTFANE